jgi:hypothetical protein
MHVPLGSERFTFPTPSSPPSTPDSVNGDTSIRTTEPISTPLPIKISNIRPAEITPPDRVHSIKRHHIPCTPPQRNIHSSDTEESEDSDTSSSSDEDEKKDIHIIDLNNDEDGDLDEINIEKDDNNHDDDDDDDNDDDDNDDDEDEDDDDERDEPATPVHVHRRTSIIVRQVDEVEDITIEEVDEDDMAYDSDTSVIHPSHLSEATSSIDHNVDGGSDADDSDLNSSDDEKDDEKDEDDDDNIYADDEETLSVISDSSTQSHNSLANDFSTLSCNAPASHVLRRHSRLLEAAHLERHSIRQRRWHRGGNKKRSHDRSCGPGADGGEREDIVMLDDVPSLQGPDRRIRRRTDEPDRRPSMGLILNRPIPGLEERGEEVVVLENEDDEDPDEVMPPAWMFSSSSAMEVDGAGRMDSSTGSLGRRRVG